MPNGNGELLEAVAVAEDVKARVGRAEAKLARTRLFEVLLVALAVVAVVLSSVSTVIIGLGNRALNERVKDCSEPQGECYQANQAATAAAVQAILDHIDGSIGPHRLRNEAENTCQTELFAGDPAYAAKGVSAALTFYNECVLRRSGNIAPPPLPPNPLTTTTTR